MSDATEGARVSELAVAFDLAPVGMAITDATATIVHANAAMAAMLGYTPAELIGKSVVDLTYPDDLAESLAANRRLRHGEVADFTLDKRYLHKTGSVVWARVYVFVLTDEPKRHLLCVTDIAHEKHSTVRLRETEARFREMAESIEQDFWIMGVTPPELLYASPAAERIWGFDPMTNRERPGRIRKLVHPDDVAEFVRLFDPSRTGSRELEYRVVTADGAPRWLRTRVFPVRNTAGTVDRLTGVTEDITPRKDGEIEIERHHAFERFVMTLSTALVDLPADRTQATYQAALGELATMIGADRGSIFVIDETTDVLSIKYAWSAADVGEETRPFTEFSFGPDNPFRAAILREGLLRVDDVAALPDEFEGIRNRILANGVRSFIDVPLVRDGKLIGLFAFATVDRRVVWSSDVAARIVIAAEVFSNAIVQARMAAELRRHRDSLAHVLRVGTMGQLASGIAHELNQPLAAILNYASACERRLDTGDTGTPFIRDTVRKIAEQAMRAADVIKTLRALVRKSDAARTWHDLDELVRTAVGFIEPETIAPGITIAVEHDPGLPQVQVDPIQIEQVVLNLVRNALDAVRAGGRRSNPTIHVSTRVGLPKQIEVRVRDNGPGIVPDEASRLFDEFYTTKSDGLGLGLSISRSIIEAHGGNLWMDASSPAGTTFCFTLPAS